MADSPVKPYPITFPVNETLILLITGVIISVYTASLTSSQTPSTPTSLMGANLVPWLSAVLYLAFSGFLYMNASKQPLTAYVESFRIGMLVLLPLLVISILTGRLTFFPNKDPRADAYRTPYTVFFAIGVIMMVVALGVLAVTLSAGGGGGGSGMAGVFGTYAMAVLPIVSTLISITVSVAILVSAVMVSQP
jgi:hypothetical protein